LSGGAAFSVDMKERIEDIVGSLTREQRAEVEAWMAGEMLRIRGDPLKYGPPPHAGQESVHASNHPHRLLISANRWGKSVCGMREVLWSATMTHPYREAVPMRTIWVGFPDFPFYRRVTRQIFLEWLPRHLLIDFHETEKWARIRRADGGICEIHFLSYDADRMKWQGASVDLCWLDEECPEDIYREAMARLIDADGRMLMTLTPVSGMGWIYDRLFLPAKLGQADIQLFQGALAEYDASLPCGVGRVLVPHLSHAKVLRFASSIPDEDERAIRIFGDFRSRSGAVYKQYRPEIHVVPAFDVPSHWELWLGLDAGYHGFAASLLAMSDDGRIYVVGEYFSQEEPLRVRAPALWQMVRGVRPLGIDDNLSVYVDTADPQLVLELNLWAQENRVPLGFASLEMGKKSRLAGIGRLQELLSPDPGLSTPRQVRRPRHELGEPRLYLFDSLYSKWRQDEDAYDGSRLAWEVARYLWKEPPKGSPHPLDADDRTAGGSHMLAALRYAVMARMGAPIAPQLDALEGLQPSHRRVWEHMQELQSRFPELPE
jgi:phage terminase large subunit-like protein